MRILHVVTLMSPDGAYGGPVRVAVNQGRELRSRGHDVVIAAAASGYPRLPDEMDGVPLELFPVATAVPGTGFAGVYAKGMRAWLRRTASSFDVAHIHLARDLVTLPAARTVLRSGVPLVVQPHGMIVPNSKLLAVPLDRFATIPLLRAASTVFHLTAREAAELRSVAGPGLALSELHNGVPVPDLPEHHDLPDDHGEPEVLFLARLHPRKRPAMFVRMARQLLAEGIDARFTLVGPDEGAAADAQREIDLGAGETRVRYEGPVGPDAAAARMARAAIYVLPSIDEPYPMSVLEAMSLGLPVVVTDSCGLAGLIADTDSGIVVGPDLASLTAAVRTLLTQSDTVRELGANAQRVARERLAMDEVAARLEKAYANARTS